MEEKIEVNETPANIREGNEREDKRKEDEEEMV